MPRIRTIKPEMASDRKFASISREARYTFVLLITQADDDGLILGSPRQLLGQLYPHDEDVDLARLSRDLREALEKGFIRWRETVDGAPVVEIVNWGKHQRIDHKAKSLILPHLAPLSRDPREDVARPSRDSRAPTLDLGPRTMDHGPSASSRKNDMTPPDRTDSDAPDGDRRSTTHYNAFVAEAGDLWTLLVGAVPHGRVAKDMQQLFRLHGGPVILTAIRNFAEHRAIAVRRGEAKPDGWPQFVRDFADYVPKAAA